jgi:DNA polymerase-1
MAVPTKEERTESRPRQLLAVVDAFSLFFKAYYAIRGLSNADGMPTNGLFGFVKMLQALLTERRPDYVAIALDSPVPTFRSEIHPEYKAHRPEPPEDLVEQIPWLKKTLGAWGLAAMQCDGFEADDVIGALARQGEQAGLDVLVVSSDKDLFQLVTGGVRILRFMKDDMEVYGRDEIHARLGVWPEQVADYLALIGDTSDNIPGVAKIGPKTAVDLLAEFGDLDSLLANLAKVKNARRRNLLEEGRESALLSKKLTLIDAAKVPLKADWDALRWPGTMITPALNDLFRKFGFVTMVVEGLGEETGGEKAPKPKDVSYSSLLTEEDLKAFARRARKSGMLAVDTETTGLDPMSCDLVGISMSIAPFEAVYVPVGHNLPGDSERQIGVDAARQILNPLFSDPSIPKTGQNIKYDLKVLRQAGFTLKGIVFDTLLASYLLEPGERHGLKSMSKRLLGVDQTPITELIGTGKNQITMAETMIDSATDYACQDADFTFRLTEKLQAGLDKEGMQGLMRELEMPLIEILAGMETEGVRLDTKMLATLAEKMRGELNALVKRVFKAAGREFTINSPKQVAEVLFEDLGLEPTKSGKTGYSTDVSVLEKLASRHPLPGLLLEYRAIEKLLSTYVEPLPAMVNPKTGRLHCSFSQTIAATGRLACHDPNLQNIPVRTERGRQIREAFLPNNKGEVLLAADYSQIELRVLAHLSGDDELVKAFTENEDIHSLTARKIFNCVPEMLTKDMRAQAKVVNFGVLYGMSAFRLADELKISRGAAQKFIDEYFAAYPKVRGWMDSILAEGRESGIVRTMSGRRRPVPELKSRSGAARRAAERVAINTPVQGSAADMIKMAMIAVDRRLKKSGLDGRMLLQVHDELIFTTPAEQAEQLKQLVVEEMEGAMELKVPVKVDVAIGANWAEC